jgi:hypothetical protein
VLELQDADGRPLRIHPVVLHQALDLVPAGGWQVRQEESALHVLVAKPGSGFDSAVLAAEVSKALDRAGAGPLAVRVETVGEIPVGASGKRPLIVARRSRASARVSAG